MTEEQSDIGNVLLQMNAVTEEQLEAAFKRQARGRSALLGALLVADGVIDEAELARALELQRKMREGDEAGAMLDLVETKTKRRHLRLHSVAGKA